MCIRDSPTPCAPRRAVTRATYGSRTHWPRSYTPSEHGLPWRPRRCASSSRSTTGCPCVSGASPDRVLRRRRRVEDARIHDRAPLDLDPLRLQMHVHCLQHQAAKIVPLQHMTEAKDRRLIRRRGDAKVNANETPYRRRLIQELFHARVRQVEPLLHKVRPQHDRQTNRPATVASLRIVRTHQRLQTCLLYTSDAADDLLCVDLGGRRIIKKQIHTVNTHVL